MSTRTAKEFVALETITAANLNRAAGGWLGYAANSSDQTSISTTNVDVNNVTVTVTVGTGRLLLVLVTATVTALANSSSYNGTIVEDSTTIGRWARTNGTAVNDIMQCSGFAITTPSAGTHTYKAVVSATAGSIEVSGTAPAQAKIVVIDLGTAA